MKTKIIQITSGRGPAECCWVVAKVLKFFIKEIENNQIKYEIIYREAGSENGAIQSVTLQLQGENLSLFLKDWLGTIQWIGASTFRKFHKRKNWFIGCFEVEYSRTLKISTSEIQFQAIRSSGPGGQHVNKVSSAIRALHIPTGIQVVAMDSRSQHQNKKIAIQRLQEKVAEFNAQQLQNNIADQWKNHLNLQRGNPVKVFKGSDFKKQNINKSYKANRKELKNNLKNELWD